MVQHSQHTNDSQHSNEDITIENLRISNDDGLILTEKYDLEVQSPPEEIPGQNLDDGHPDGGFTAWLMVAGVRLIFPSCAHDLIIPLPPLSSGDV